MRTDNAEIQLTAMQSLFDFLLMYDLFEDEDSNNNDSNANNNNNNNNISDEQKSVESSISPSRSLSKSPSKGSQASPISSNNSNSNSNDSSNNINNNNNNSNNAAASSRIEGSVDEETADYDAMQLQPKSTQELIEVMKYFLQCEDAALLECCVDGFTKLLFMNRLKCYKTEILTRLFLLYFNPIMKENDKVRQTLSVFFPYFADAKTFPNHRKLISECIFHCVRVCCYAPQESPLYNVSLTKLTEYILWLLNADPLTSGDSAGKQNALASDLLSIHESLAFDILFEIDAQPGIKQIQTLSRLLTILQLNRENPHNIKQYKVLADRIKTKIKDKNGKKYFEKFITMLDKLDSKPNESLSETQLKDLADLTKIKIQEIEKEHLKYLDEDDIAELEAELELSEENNNNNNNNNERNNSVNNANESDGEMEGNMSDENESNDEEMRMNKKKLKGKTGLNGIGDEADEFELNERNSNNINNNNNRNENDSDSSLDMFVANE